MASESPSPTDIRAIAITAADLVSAIETNRTGTDHAVLRITPPFSGRMRARLHVELDGSYETPRPIHIEPERLVGELPSYPRPAETEDELRADPDRTYTVENHHEYHTRAVEQWRETVAERVRDRATIETMAGEVTVDIAVLGGTD